MIGNEYVDQFQAAQNVVDEHPTLGAGWGNLFGPVELRSLSSRWMHFSSLKDGTIPRCVPGFLPDKAKDLWDRLRLNTYAQAMTSKESGDVVGFLTLLGMTLHAVQDFYSHSNWVQLVPNGDSTFFDVRPDAAVLNNVVAADSLYCDDRLSNSPLPSPYFIKTYGAAFWATVQWLRAVRQWVGDDFWNRARDWSANADALANELRDLRYLSWYAGQWKGGAREDDDLGGVGIWYSLPTASHPPLEAWKRLCPLLWQGPVYSGVESAIVEPLPHDSAGAEASAGERVFLRRWLVVRIDDVAMLPGVRPDPYDGADFYAKVDVDNRQYFCGFAGDDKQAFSTHWNWVVLVPMLGSNPQTKRHYMNIALMDEDAWGGFESSVNTDDEIDIMPGEDAKLWQANYTEDELLGAGRFIETSGSGDNDPGRMSFAVWGEDHDYYAKPRVLSISPWYARPGDEKSVKIIGDDLRDVTDAFFEHSLTEQPSGIGAAIVSVPNPQEMTVNVHVFSDALPGPRNVIVRTLKNGQTAEAALEGAFSVLGPPVVTSVTPNAASAKEPINAPVTYKRGATLGNETSRNEHVHLSVIPQEIEVTILGENFSGATGVYIVSGQHHGRLSPRRHPASPSNVPGGVVVSSFEVVSNTEIRALIHVEPTASSGYRDVQVECGPAKGHGDGLFFVVTGLPSIQTPLIPAQAAVGETLDVLVKGDNFCYGTDVGFSGTGIHVLDVRVASHDQLVVSISIDAQAPIEKRTVTVYTPEGLTTLPEAFDVVFLHLITPPAGIEGRRFGTQPATPESTRAPRALPDSLDRPGRGGGR
ncbi:MAG: hypothetical protein NTX53_12710 [candidate division WOR-3 bacterium]|nr:hypothetical protein [candidate division WOR-3 bacterium]